MSVNNYGLVNVYYDGALSLIKFLKTLYRYYIGYA